MSSCLSGGSRTYGFDLEIVKSPATSTRASPASSSLTSTVSESSNSPLSICTRKARTQRKRPNQTYNEAAALLSTAFPNIFSATHLSNPRKSHRPHRTYSPDESSELFLPFRVIEDESVFLFHHPGGQRKPAFFQIESKQSPSHERCCQTPEENEIQSKVAAHHYDEGEEDFDAESMLDEEIEEGIIDSIMGERSGCIEEEKLEGESNIAKMGPSWSRAPPMALLGLGGRLDICYGIRRAGVSAWRDVGRVNWWNFPTVDVNEISPKLNPNCASSAVEKKKKKKKVEKPQLAEDGEGIRNAETCGGKEDWDSPGHSELGGKKSGLMLKLDYNNVMNAWTGRGCPFPDDCPSSGNDVAGRLAKMIELLGEGEGMREASVQRYKEKRRNRLFSKKIRYQVRKLNADCRPRMKGRFVRRPNTKLIKDIHDDRIGNNSRK